MKNSTNNKTKQFTETEMQVIWDIIISYKQSNRIVHSSEESMEEHNKNRDEVLEKIFNNLQILRK
tara:strand:- start:431 stop:625 length:195 start_codon:yes stop_codon:yes gene_type:complete